MKKVLLGLLVVIIAQIGYFWGGSVYAIDVMNLPKIQAYVTDHTSTLNSTQLDSLNTQASELESFQGSQVVTVIIPDRQGNELYDIGLKIARENALGDKTLNNGLLLLIAKDEKKLRIMVGYGLEGALPDIKAREIVEEIRPLVNNGDIYGANKLWYQRAEQILKGEFEQTVKNGVQSSFSGDPLGILIMFLFFVLIPLYYWGQEAGRWLKPRTLFDDNIIHYFELDKKKPQRSIYYSMKIGILVVFGSIFGLFILGWILATITQIGGLQGRIIGGLFTGASGWVGGFISGLFDKVFGQWGKSYSRRSGDTNIWFPGGFSGGGSRGGGGGFGGGFSGGGGGFGGGGAGD